MPDAPDPEASPRSHRRRVIYPGLVWAVPLAALLVVAYLGIQAVVRRGEVVTVTFRRAADARADDTKVLYQGVEAGHLIKIVPNKDGRRLDFKLRLMPAAKAGLNSNARFWLIGASPNLADLSSLKAVVSGVAIGYAPGEGGTPTDTFEGLDKAPTILPGEKGTRYLLTAHTLGPIGEGSILLFHGQAIGKVSDVIFNGEAGFRLEVFVYQPYDQLVRPGARFWKSSPLRFSLAGGGFNATLAPASTLLAGGIDLELPAIGGDGHRSAAETEFPLFASRSAARQGLTGPTVRYDFAFGGAAGTLDEEAPVTLLGFQIGEVETVKLAYDPVSDRPYTIATAAIYPRQLGLAQPASNSAEDWRSATDAKLRKLIQFGYRARLQQTPALIGTQSIALVETKGARVALLTSDGANPRIPSAPGSSGIEDITTQADRFLTKLNAIPLEQIGKNLKEITGRLNHTIASPQMRQSLDHLTSTLAEVDQMLGQVQPQLGPLLIKLNEAAAQVSGTARAAHELLDSSGSAQSESLPEAIKQLSDAARSIRSLADYLDRHPEALLRGKRPE